MAKRLLITSDRLGSSNEELGRILMRSFLGSLASAEPLPVAIMLANDGVRLACEGSVVLQELSALAAAGVTLRACGTCLQHLGLAASLVVGEAGNMAQVVAAVCGPDDIVTIA